VQQQPACLKVCFQVDDLVAAVMADSDLRAGNSGWHGSSEV
jgi:hypothetical protein